MARLCVECHGAELKGGGFLQTPDLTVAAAYGPEGFVKLMHTGKATGDRELGMMSGVSRSRFSALTDEEVAALHAYLKARAEKVIRQAEAGNLSTP